MKVIIAGSRSYTDYDVVKKMIDQVVESGQIDIDEVVSGTARGVDKFGERWAEENNISIKRFPANWDKYGKKAGYLRNAEMGDYADGAIVIWDGISFGSKMMADYMKKLNKPYVLVAPQGVSNPNEDPEFF